MAVAKTYEALPLVDKESLIPIPAVEDKDKSDDDFDNFPLKYTTTDVAILACSRLYHSDKMTTRDCFGFLSGFLLHIAAQGMQFMLLYLMLQYNVEPMEDAFENDQFDHMSTALSGAIQSNTALPLGLLATPVSGYTHANCKGNTSPVGVRFIFLILWFGISWEALSTTLFRFSVVWSIPKNDDDPLLDTNAGISLNSAPEKGNHDITHIERRWKLFIFVFILVPHAATILLLVWTGTKIQAFAPTVAVQAKASLKLGIITTVTSTLMTYYGCAHMHKYMGVDPENKDTPVAVNYRMVTPAGAMRKSSTLAKMMASQAWKTWAETVVKLVLGLAFALAIVYLMYPNKEVFDNLCDKYYEDVVGCSKVKSTGRTPMQKSICPQFPVRDWFGFGQ